MNEVRKCVPSAMTQIRQDRFGGIMEDEMGDFREPDCEVCS